ncbi:MAG: amino acid racemase [bacterium]|nr:amino acid racemase [bacterium]
MQTIGVLGGLGPETTATFYLDLVRRATRERRPRVCIWSLPLDVRKESEYIAQGAHRRYYQRLLAHGATALEQAGSSCLVIPCNTVHEFHPALSRITRVPIVNLIDVVVRAVLQRKWHRVLLLATSRTIHTQLYQRALVPHGVDVQIPCVKEQRALDRLIQGLLGDRRDPEHQAFLRSLVLQAGTEHIVLGCTDLQLLFPIADEVIDSMSVLAEHTASICLRNSVTPRKER